MNIYFKNRSAFSGTRGIEAQQTRSLLKCFKEHILHSTIKDNNNHKGTKYTS